MKVHYSVDKLEGLMEVDLNKVDFETIHSCPVCSSADLFDVSVLKNSLITSCCKQCSHMFQRRRPPSDWFKNWYQSNWDKQTAHPVSRPLQPNRSSKTKPGFRGLKRKLKASLNKRLSLLTGIPAEEKQAGRMDVYDFCWPITSKGLKVLDIGCGYGDVLLPFQNNGCTAFGIEASEHRSQAAGSLGIKIANVAVENLGFDTFSTHMDMVVSNHVLEHIHDPDSFFLAAKRLLKSGGWLCLTVPNLENDFFIQNFFFALHIHFYSRNSLLHILKKFGFVLHKITEDHQLRVLARYQPDLEIPSAFEEEFYSGSAFKEPPAQTIFSNTLGPQYKNNMNKTIYCKWGIYPDLLQKVYDVIFETKKDPLNIRMMRLKWDDELKLPLEFTPMDPDKEGAAFWVK